ncbi:MAG: hypothetical protein K6G26_02035, partial [Lachnospiraceae bacterium]|nr:hypothetical protein [Lachnospiraceae bacterium]
MIVFRADGNTLIGLGHIMRCLSIADSFTNIGKTCTFVTSDNELNNIIVNRGYENIILNSKYNNLDTETEMLKTIFNKLDI